MALKIASIARQNGSTCDHLRVRIEDTGGLVADATLLTAGTLVQVAEVSRGELVDGSFLRQDWPPRVLLALLWLRYRISQGAALTDLIDKVVA